MATRRPLAVIGGRVQEVPVGDTLPADLVPASSGTDSGALIEGGTWTTDHSANLRIFAGGWS